MPFKALCFSYFAQAVYFVSSPFGLGCQDSSLWFFEQHLEAREAKAFAGKTRSKSTRKAREKNIYAQMFVL
jgi:hypothetical protein